MPNYCLNGGRCINKAQDEEDAMDTTIAPICICPPTRMGARCEIFRAPTLPTTTTTTTTSTTSSPFMNNTAAIHASGAVVGETLARKLVNNSLSAWFSNSEVDSMRSSGALSEQASPEKVLNFFLI